jgi:polysaccharide transporter, PST family
MGVGGHDRLRRNRRPCRRQRVRRASRRPYDPTQTYPVPRHVCGVQMVAPDPGPFSMQDMSQQPRAPSSPEDELSATDIKSKAARGVLAVGVRGIAIRTLGLLGNIVLARLLAPDQFGLIALGFTFLILGSFITNGGIGAHLLRTPSPPERTELEAVYGLQLTVAIVLAILTAAIGIPLGTAGAVAAIMACSLPIDATRTPAALMAERRLNYRALVRAEVLEILAYNALAIAAVALGAGVWGVAAAVVARSLVGTTLVVTTLPPGLVRPRWSWKTVQPLLGFGLAFQSISVVNLVRDQGLVLITGAVAGLATLGYWSIAYRIVQVLVLVLESLWRVSFPAVARLIEVGEDLAPPLQRALRVSATVLGLVVAGLIGTAPALVPLLFGERWDPAVPAVAWSAAGLMVAGPISTASAGLLLARGRVNWVLRATVLHTVTWIAVTTPLLPSLGVKALGIGWFAGCCVDGAMLGVYAKREVHLAVVASLARPVGACAAAAAVAWWLAHVVNDRLLGSVVAGAASVGLYLVVLGVVSPGDLRETRGLLVRTLRPAPNHPGKVAVAEGP